ncbi:pyridoxamine 5'-phosphate oxidase [Gaiella sp.]|uniref:pyridoxamine 5'-phosphate oxidase n=1 Tax=Gaiella sp. TaxID=2663207 RepID=UPI003264D63B
MRTGDLSLDPHAQFDTWFGEAIAGGVPDPEQMALATATLAGAPSVRMVLLKGHDERGFVFYTNRTSRKGAELRDNARAAGVLHWKPLERQVRIEGSVEELSAQESSAYFGTRPRDSQISAWASPQSQPVSGRDELERRAAEVAERFDAQASLPLPPFWGGYRIVVTTFEFWQGRPGRLHDRVQYALAAGGWTKQRLAP